MAKTNEKAVYRGIQYMICPNAKNKIENLNAGVSEFSVPDNERLLALKADKDFLYGLSLKGDTYKIYRFDKDKTDPISIGPAEPIIKLQSDKVRSFYVRNASISEPKKLISF